MQDLLYDHTPRKKIGDLTTKKKDKSTAQSIVPVVSATYAKYRKTLNTNNVNPDDDLTKFFNLSLDDHRKFWKEENQKAKQKTRQTTFRNKQLSRTTPKYTSISEWRKTHQGGKRTQGGKYSKIKRKRVTRKGMCKTSSKSRKHYKRR